MTGIRPTELKARISQLEAEKSDLLADIEKLQERIADLELANFDSVQKRILNMTPTETRFTLACFQRDKPLRIFSRHYVREMVWGSREITKPLVSIMVLKCNEKFAELGVEKGIVTFWGQGIGLSPEAHALVTRALDDDF